MSEGAYLNRRVNLPLVAGERSHGTDLGKWDFTPEATDVRLSFVNVEPFVSSVPGSRRGCFLIQQVSERVL